MIKIKKKHDFLTYILKNNRHLFQCVYFIVLFIILVFSCIIWRNFVSKLYILISSFPVHQIGVYMWIIEFKGSLRRIAFTYSPFASTTIKTIPMWIYFVFTGFLSQAKSTTIAFTFNNGFKQKNKWDKKKATCIQHIKFVLTI